MKGLCRIDGDDLRRIGAVGYTSGYAGHDSFRSPTLYDRHGYAEEDRRIMAAVARHLLLSVVE